MCTPDGHVNNPGLLYFKFWSCLCLLVHLSWDKTNFTKANGHQQLVLFHSLSAENIKLPLVVAPVYMIKIGDRVQPCAESVEVYFCYRPWHNGSTKSTIWPMTFKFRLKLKGRFSASSYSCRIMLSVEEKSVNKIIAKLSGASKSLNNKSQLKAVWVIQFHQHHAGRPHCTCCVDVAS